MRSRGERRLPDRQEERMTTVRRNRTIPHPNRLCLLVAIVAAGGALMTGCGGSSSSSSSAAPASTAAGSSTRARAANRTPRGAATGTGSSGSSGSSSTTGGSGVANNPTVKAAVARCKQSIASAPTLSGDAKTKLQALCAQAAQGDPASLRKATAQVCEQIVKETVPASAQTAALASCPKA